MMGPVLIIPGQPPRQQVFYLLKSLRQIQFMVVHIDLQKLF